MVPPKKGDLNAAEKKIFECIPKGSQEEIRTLLKEPGVHINCLDESGMTPLQHAAFKARKDLCELFLAHGADVNSNNHENGYTALMFAALSGNTKVTKLMLDAGGNVNHINSVNRTAAQMAGFVGHHECVTLINNFIPQQEIDYFSKIHGLEKEPKLPVELVSAVCQLVNISNLNPVKISMYLRDNKKLVENYLKVSTVLDALCQKNMKARDTNDAIAIKMHYLSRIVQRFAKSEKTESWIKSLLRGRESDGFPETQERLIRQCLKEFPFAESELLQQFVRNIVPVEIGNYPTALSILSSGINGQQFVRDEDAACTTCGDPKAPKKCSACKMVNYCNLECQKLHWFTHKKFCKHIAEEHKNEEEEEAEEEELEKKVAQTNIEGNADASGGNELNGVSKLSSTRNTEEQGSGDHLRNVRDYCKENLSKRDTKNVEYTQDATDQDSSKQPGTPD